MCNVDNIFSGDTAVDLDLWLLSLRAALLSNAGARFFASLLLAERLICFSTPEALCLHQTVPDKAINCPCCHCLLMQAQMTTTGSCSKLHARAILEHSDMPSVTVCATEDRSALVTTLATGRMDATYRSEQAHRCLHGAGPGGRQLRLLQTGSCLGTTGLQQISPALLCRQLAMPLSASSCTSPSCLHPTSSAALRHNTDPQVRERDVLSGPNGLLNLHRSCRTL